MSSDRLPWGKFVWSDWENDPALALVSMGAQGFWMRLLCLAVKEGGYVLVGGVKPEPVKLARLCRCSIAEAEEWLAELEAEKVFSRTSDGVIYSRRMVREAKLSRRNRENGAKGGNPTLRKAKGNGASDNPTDEPPSQPHAQKGVKAEENRREESREDSSVSDETGASAGLGEDDRDPLADLRALPIAKGCWRLATRVLVEQGGLTDPKARAFVGKLKQNGLTDAELWQIAEAAFSEQTENPQPYLLRAAEGVIARRGEGGSSMWRPRLLNPDPERQRFWMQDWREHPGNWKRQDRGPEPGQPGCQVSAEIQREFGVEPAAPQPVRRAG